MSGKEALWSLTNSVVHLIVLVTFGYCFAKSTNDPYIGVGMVAGLLSVSKIVRMWIKESKEKKDVDG